MRRKPRYTARLANTDNDRRAAQKLRYRVFIEAAGAVSRNGGLDADAFDALCWHVLIEDQQTGDLVATFRLLPLNSGADIGESYAGQYYDLAALASFDQPMVEMGRFCVAPGRRDPDILRTAWGAITELVDREGIGMIFGCSSFKGTDADAYADAFAMLQERHIAPRRWLPQIKAPNVLRFAERFRRKPDRAQAIRTMPPLLRSYLSMGGWVSDHAVVDRDLNTLHVFTGLEIARVPAARARVLRAIRA